MFMTTNRIQSMDPAFRSRMHLILEYKSLDPSSRKGLWRLFLERTADYKKQNWPDAEVDRLAAFDLNGRQIKNIVRTANSLALAEGHRLSVEEVEIVLSTVTEFHSTLESN